MKRLFDLAVAGLVLTLTAPLAAVVALLIAVRLGRPVIFSQERPGREGVCFRLYKFRTMTGTRDAAGQLLPDEERRTPFGDRLRALSLDELPQLWNVLRGELSLVGPRPLLIEYLPLYSPEQARRHAVTPGITGWAQVNGRNAISWDEKFAHDLWYVDHQSFRLDLRILVMTARQVLGRRGIGHGGDRLMPRFTGNQTAPPEPAMDRPHGRQQ